MNEHAKEDNRDRGEARETAPGDSGAAEAARLRDRIDRGGAADKNAFSDPSAAPLGTDAEAAGTPPTREQVAWAADAEAGRAPEAARKPGPADLQGNRSRPWALILGVLVAVIVIAALVFGIS